MLKIHPKKSREFMDGKSALRLTFCKMHICLLFLSLYFVVSVSAAADGEKVTYEKHVKPIISQRCFSCHGGDAPTIHEFEKDKERFKKLTKGPKMDTYENLMIFVNGKDAGALMRRLDDGKNAKDGKPGNMFRHLGSTDPEKVKNLETVKKWIGGWTLKRKAEMTEEDLKTIKATER